MCASAWACSLYLRVFLSQFIGDGWLSAHPQGAGVWAVDAGSGGHGSVHRIVAHFLNPRFFSMGLCYGPL